MTNPRIPLNPSKIPHCFNCDEPLPDWDELSILVDEHGHPMCEECWADYRRAITYDFQEHGYDI